MSFELEVLVGHLYIVGGRSINTTPPGTLVEVAPKTAARGREPDTFFAMVLPSGDANAPTTFYQQMAQMAAERYFGSSGSVTAALRNVFNSLNYNLFEHNDSGRKHYEASMICAALRGKELFLARVGPAVAVLRGSTQTLSFPEDLDADEAIFTVPLGVQPIPDVKMTRYMVSSGSRLLLGDVNVTDFDREKLTDALMALNVENALDAVKELAYDRLSVMLVEFVPPEEPVPLMAATGPSSLAIAAEVTAARAQARATGEMPAIKTAEKRLPRPKRPNELQTRLKRGIGEGAHKLATGFEVMNKGLDVVLPQPKEGEKRPLSATVTGTIVVALPLLVVAAVVLMWASGIGPTEYEQCLEQATSASSLARNIDSSDRVGTQAAWQGTLEIINSCESIRPNDPALVAVRTEAQTILDRLNGVRRRQAIPIATLPNASLNSILLQGLDTYVLDDNNDLVYRIRLSSDGLSGVATDAITSMRRGASVDGFPVGDLIDIAYDDTNNEIVALDSQGVLVRCPPQFIGQCDAQRVLQSERWGSVAAITIWRGRLYVLDTAQGQIWRYEPSGKTYSSAPAEYFTGQVRPNLGNAIDFAIDSGGRIYILYTDGVMTAWRSGAPENFTFSGFQQGQELGAATVQAMFLNDSKIDPAFFILSRPLRRIYETTQSGTFANSYTVFDENNFALLADVVAEPSLGIIYAVSGNAIFALRKDE